MASAIARDRRISSAIIAVTSGSNLLQGQPYLEGTEAARVLRAIVDIVCRVFVEVIVGRVVREGGARRVLIAGQYATGLERCIEPLVRIDRYGIGLGCRMESASTPGLCAGAAVVIC
jgi:hypothetical protein